MPVLKPLNDDEGELERLSLGEVVAVATTRVQVEIRDPERLRRARVGRLVVVKGVGGDEWLLGMIEKVWRAQVKEPKSEPAESDEQRDDDLEEELPEPGNDGATFVLLGTYRGKHGETTDYFTRALLSLPDIGARVVLLEERYLENFMGILAHRSGLKGPEPLEIGTFSLGRHARTFLDGDRLFQRHAALVGSTGAGKSWAVAAMLERAATLPHADIIVFDLHGEYGTQPYARQFRVAGPTDLGTTADDIFYLPYWLLDFDELQQMLVDQTEFTAQNQVLQIHNAVERAKRKALEDFEKADVLRSFTVDSPVPYSLDAVVADLKRLNEEKVQGTRGLKQGPFHGQFGRLLERLARKQSDRRYGFLYQVPGRWMRYEALHELAEQLLGHGGLEDEVNPGIKVIDFSEVPSDILPVMVGLVARLVFDVQMWSAAGQGRQPIALVCDEAHLYMPRAGQDLNPLARRALRSFERIAKEGRKYGVGLLVVSQRPADLSETILSQCNNFICLRLTNAKDQSAVKQLLPESIGGVLDALPALEVGEAVVVGDAVLLPARVKLDAPTTQPLSATVDFWTRWEARDQTGGDLVAAVEALRRQGRERASD